MVDLVDLDEENLTTNDIRKILDDGGRIRMYSGKRPDLTEEARGTLLMEVVGEKSR